MASCKTRWNLCGIVAGLFCAIKLKDFLLEIFFRTKLHFQCWSPQLCSTIYLLHCIISFKSKPLNLNSVWYFYLLPHNKSLCIGTCSLYCNNHHLYTECTVFDMPEITFLSRLYLREMVFSTIWNYIKSLTLKQNQSKKNIKTTCIFVKFCLSTFFEIKRHFQCWSLQFYFTIYLLHCSISCNQNLLNLNLVWYIYLLP